jgi:flagellar biosynthesis/type III secretory pathway chaperone
MSDACVKYDNQKKLWLYLHLDRNDQHRWEDNEEYNVKKSYKKRKGDDYDMDRF